jgi:hypothetical protein
VKLNFYQIVSIALPAIVMSLFFMKNTEPEIRLDSGGYLNFSASILSGEIWEKQELNEVRYARAIRTPGYPLVIGLATGGDIEAKKSNILVAHLLFALFTIVFLSVQLRHLCPPFITAGGVFVVEFFMRDYFQAIMTEFIAFNMLLILFGLVVGAVEAPTARRIFFIGFIAALGALIRPAMIVCAVLVPLLVIYRRRLSIKEGFIFTASLLPVLLWMTFNLVQIGAFTITQVSGLNALGIGAQVGYAEAQSGDSEDLVAYIEAMNKQKIPPMGTEDEHINNLEPDYKFFLLQNTYYTSSDTRWSVGHIPYDREYMFPYGTRAIKANPGNYIKYVVYGLGLFFAFVFPFASVAMLIIPLAGIYQRKAVALSYACIGLFAVHVASGVVTAAYEGVWDRYIIMTFYPYLLAVLLCLSQQILSAGSVQDIAESLPAGLRNTFGGFFRLS